MMPTKLTTFLPLSDIEKYCEQGYDCGAIVFSPETENNHFSGCPPYIMLFKLDGSEDLFFEVPKPVAYYGTTHAGYTMKGRERAVQRGREAFRQEIKDLIIGDEE